MSRTWKRLLVVFAALMLVAAACGDSDDSSTDAGADDTSDTTEASSETTAAPTETTEGSSDTTAAPSEGGAGGELTNLGLTYDIGGRGDQSFNDSAAAGADEAIAEFGITVSEAEPNADGSDRAELLQAQADQSELVIGVGFLFADDVANVAADNPDTLFAVIDDSMLNFEADPPEPRGENIAGLVFSEEQGSYLVGAAAGLKTETGKIGFIGGVSGYGLIEKFEAGYIAGAKATNPDIEILSEYITEFPDFDGFVAPDRAREIGAAMYADGADIVYHAAGASGIGLFPAAKEYSEANDTKVWAIGVDSDQYNAADAEVQEYILTSMVKRVDVAVLDVTTAVADGTFAPGETRYDLAVDGVGYSTSGGFIDDIVDQLEDFKAQIIAGDIEVPTDPTGL